VGTAGNPVLHVLGFDVSIGDLGLRPSPADPGEHGGDRTAITVGQYRYATAPDWIGGVDVRRVHVERAGGQQHRADGRGPDVTLHDVTVHGGHTGVAVHWGAVGTGVSTIDGPTYHPHRLSITGLRVRAAVEGFYLSSCTTSGSSAGACATWGWGSGCCPATTRTGSSPIRGSGRTSRSPTGACGGRVRTTAPGSPAGAAARSTGWSAPLRYRDTVVRDCVLSGRGAAARSPVLIESADGVDLHDIRVESAPDAAGRGCCVTGAQH
jgi:hypothetical protein